MLELLVCYNMRWKKFIYDWLYVFYLRERNLLPLFIAFYITFVLYNRKFIYLSFFFFYHFDRKIKSFLLNIKSQKYYSTNPKINNNTFLNSLNYILQKNTQFKFKVIV